MRKIVIFVTFILCFLFLLTNKAFAKGEISCVWLGVAGECRRIANCEAGYKPSPINPCAGLGNDVCGTTSGGNCIPEPGTLPQIDPCDSVPDDEPDKKADCHSCFTPGGVWKDGGAWTALGCLPSDPKELVIWVLGGVIGIGGGIAFLLMLFGGFQVLTSAGDPERLNSGKDVIGSALTGLLLIIFSLFILRLIGVDILGLGNVGFKLGGP